MPLRPGVVIHASNPSIWKTEVDLCKSIQPGATLGVPGQPQLPSETLSQKRVNEWGLETQLSCLEH